MLRNFLQGCSQEQEVKKEMTNMETALLAATEKMKRILLYLY